jgi:hypothetical protein
MSFKNFNRHDIFDAEMMNNVQSIIQELSNVGIGRSVLLNKLYGLFDGFLYNDLIVLAKADRLSEQSITKLSNLIEKIEAHIAENGETETMIF